MKIYIIGSLRRPEIRILERTLEAEGYDVFAQWHAAGPQADDEWQRYFRERGDGYKTALYSPMVTNIREFDRRWLDWAETVVAYGPLGLSSGLELFYCAASGKRPILYLPVEPERYDAMVPLIPALEIVESEAELLAALSRFDRFATGA